MYNKNELFDLIAKCRDKVLNNKDYILCNNLLKKIGTLMFSVSSDSGEIKIDITEIDKITDDEYLMFTSPNCKRILASFKEIPGKQGWRVETVHKLIKALQDDIKDNKLCEFTKMLNSLDELSRIIEEESFQKHYDVILSFIKMNVDNNFLSIDEGTKLNFYVLMESVSLNRDKESDDDLKLIELNENNMSVEEIRENIQKTFAKYGYIYDENKMDELDKKFVKYVNIEYLDYVLSKFQLYGIDNNELYVRKNVLCRIVIDNDKDTFDSIINFINDNKCSLSALLKIPAIFSKGRRNYVGSDSIFIDSSSILLEIAGANNDFFNNIEIYKKLAGVSVIQDKDLVGLKKFLCTPSSLINKNIALLEKYRIVQKGKLPKSVLSLCGNHTEYLIDRFIEAGLHESYLSSRIIADGQIKEPRGAYMLDKDDNPFRFYKIKRALDLGKPVLASNAGLKKVLKNDDESYMGISLKLLADGKKSIEQEPLSLEVLNGIDAKIRKVLPVSRQYNDVNNGMIISSEKDRMTYFNLLYKYKTVSPVELFNDSQKISDINLRGERINGIFSKDYDSVISADKMENIARDKFIKLLDNGVYCDSRGNSLPMKITELKYEFFHPSFPNVNVIISRYKVLRLCKLLKENGCWINNNSSDYDKENTILSILLKDTIISETEVLVLRLVIKELLSNEFVMMPGTITDVNDRRGAR